MTNYTRKALGGALISYSFFCLSSLLALAIRIVLARRLSVEEFGLFYSIMATIFMFSFLRDLAMSEAEVMFIPRFMHKRELSRIKGLFYFVLNVQVFMGTLFFIALAILAPTLALHYFKSPLAEDILIIIALTFILEGVFEGIQLAFKGLYLIFHQTSMQFVRLIVILGITSFLLGKGWGIRAPAVAYLLSPIIVGTIYYWLLRRGAFRFFSTVKRALSLQNVKEYLTYSLPILPGTAGMDLFIYRITIIMITTFANLQQVALYAAAFTISKLIQLIRTPIQNILFPVSSELWESGKKNRLIEGVNLLYRYSLIVALPLVGILVAFPGELLGAFYGQAYTEAWTLLPVLGFAMVILTYTQIVEAVFLGIGQSFLSTKQIYVGGGINIGLGLLLIPAYGMYGAAISFLIGMIGMMAYGMVNLHRFVKARVPWSSWGRTLLASAGLLETTFLLKGALRGGIWLNAAISLSGGCITYLALLLLLRVTTIKELREIVSRFSSPG